MTDLQIVTGPAPDSVTAFAAAELARYARDLFGVAAAVGPRPGEASASVWLDGGGAGLAAPADPQSYLLRRFSRVGRGRPSAGRRRQPGRDPMGGVRAGARLGGRVSAARRPAARCAGTIAPARGRPHLHPQPRHPLLAADQRLRLRPGVVGPGGESALHRPARQARLQRDPAVAVAVAVVRALRVRRRRQAHRLLLVRLPLSAGRAHRGPRGVRRGDRIREPGPGRDHRLPGTPRRGAASRRRHHRARRRPRHQRRHVAVAAGVSPGVPAGDSRSAGGAPARREDLRARQRSSSRRPAAGGAGAYQAPRPPAVLPRRRAPVPGLPRAPRVAAPRRKCLAEPGRQVRHLRGADPGPGAGGGAAAHRPARRGPSAR